DKIPKTPIKIIDCIKKTAKEISFGELQGFGEALSAADARPMLTMSNGRKAEDKFKMHSVALSNKDFHIEAYGWQGEEMMVRVAAKKKNIKVKGIIVHFHDESGKLIGTALTDTEGKAVINLKDIS
ncbi:MAG: hypothetical protein JRI77_17065, partial [Deltaproteobacteria bacterium]|nr:hypothetical protein [Deltaproteobacteria bacterium]